MEERGREPASQSAAFRAKAEPKAQARSLDWSDCLRGDVNLVHLAATYDFHSQVSPVERIAAHLNFVRGRNFPA